MAEGPVKCGWCNKKFPSLMDMGYNQRGLTRICDACGKFSIDMMKAKANHDPDWFGIQLDNGLEKKMPGLFKEPGMKNALKVYKKARREETKIVKRTGVSLTILKFL